MIPPNEYPKFRTPNKLMSTPVPKVKEFPLGIQKCTILHPRWQDMQLVPCHLINFHPYNDESLFLPCAPLNGKTFEKVRDTSSRFLTCSYSQNFTNRKLSLFSHFNTSVLLFCPSYPLILRLTKISP